MLTTVWVWCYVHLALNWSDTCYFTFYVSLICTYTCIFLYPQKDENMLYCYFILDLVIKTEQLHRENPFFVLEICQHDHDKQYACL